MAKQITKTNDQITPLLRYAWLVVPFLMLIFGIFARLNIVNGEHYTSDILMISSVIGWAFLSFYQFFYKATTKNSKLFQIGLFHILAFFYFVFVTGVASPLISVWVLLFLTTYIYFNKIGLLFSASILFVSTVTDSYLSLATVSSTIENFLSTITIGLLGVAVLFIDQVQKKSENDLIVLQNRETLERQRILTIVNNLSDAIISTDKKGVIQVHNAATLNLLDTNINLTGKKIDAIISLHDSTNASVTIRDLIHNARTTTVRDDLILKTSDGETLRLEVTFSPIRSSFSESKKAEVQDGYIFILRDVTKAKSLEEERDEFISVVSHELRTPITIAEGTISNVQIMMERPNVSPEILKTGIKTAHDQVIFLAKMMNDLSTLSRAERGVADEAESIPIHELVNELYADYAPESEKKALHFNLDLSADVGSVRASRLYLKELLQDFITNAIKYTHTGSVTLKVLQEKNNIVFSVSDTGIGISKADQAKIYDKFYRSEDYRTRETGGTGLGLYVAQKLSKKLGTKIELKSRLNHGSCFSFTLPSEDK